MEIRKVWFGPLRKWCVAEFRFQNDMYDLPGVLQIREEIVCYNGTKVSDIEDFCIFLKRHAYPCRYLDLIHRFARTVPELFTINKFESTMVISKQFPNIYWCSSWQRSPSLENCCGFVNGTVSPICRLEERQRIMYNGNKKVHAIKFQTVVASNGLITILFCLGRHDSGVLGDSGLLHELQQHANYPNGNILCIYGDPTYSLR